ncbi:MAG: hypothetical protein ABJH07_08245 [Sedimentitalea sp.]|uniref:hypothetical protein n=1 Tax=Sedimentitalea sp. TaxID=2048915 RepID=UPI003263C75D
MTVSQYLGTEFQDIELRDAMRTEVSALSGVTDEQGRLLSSLGINTVFDLAVSQVFADARRLLLPGAAELVWRDEDLFPRDLLKPAVEIVGDIASMPIQSLARVAARLATAINTTLGIQTIGELALWPPYVAARELGGFDEGLNAALEDPEASGIPAELIPTMNDQASEKAFYTVYSEVSTRSGTGSLQGAVSLDDIALKQARSDVTLGYILRYEQSWTPVGLTLGNLLHSLALAPGEATRIAITSWDRQQSASTSESVSQNEALSNVTSSQRTISEITSAVAREASEGFSNINSNTTIDNTGNAQYGLLNSGEALTAGAAGFTAGAAAGVVPGAAAGAGIGALGGGVIGAFVGGVGAGPGAAAGAIGGGLVGAGSGALVTGAAGGAMGFMGTANFGSDLNSSSDLVLNSVTVTSTDGTREVESEMMQSVADQTQQQASSARTRTASIVQEVSQSESENVSTRVVANYNHMHAMTVQYFEVVQTYRQETRLLKEEPCVYVPVGPVRKWTEELIRKYRGQLLQSAISSDFAFHLMAAYGTVGLQSPTFETFPEAERSALGNEAIQRARDVLDVFVGANPHNDWRVPSNVTISMISGTWMDGGTVFTHEIDSKLDFKLFAKIRGSRGREQISKWELDVPFLELDGLEFEASAKPREDLDLLDMLADPISVRFGILFDIPDSSDQFTFHALGAVDSSHIVRRGRTDKGKIVFPILNVSPVISLKKAIDHLTENTEWYSRQILRLKDKRLARTLVDNLSFDNSVLGDHVDPEPVAINGDRLIFKLQSRKFRETVKSKDVSTHELVPVGTGGVFAEAVLGRANSAEKIDLTRFWNWQDSPIPLTPPEIAPVQTGSRAQAVNLAPGRLDAPLVQNSAARAIPDPQGTLAVLNTLQQQLFKDMSGILETAQVAQTALQQAASASTATGDAASENLQKGMEQTGKIVEQATKMVGDFGSMIAEKSLDVLNTGVAGALGSTGGAGGLLGSPAGGGFSGATGGVSSNPSAIRAGAGLAGNTGAISGGGLAGSATGIGGAINEARKLPSSTGSLPNTSVGPTQNSPMQAAGGGSRAETSLPEDIIKSATGVPPGYMPPQGVQTPPAVTEGSSLETRVASELRPLVARASRSDADYDLLLGKTMELIELAHATGQPHSPVYSTLGDALSLGWKAAALRTADRFNTGEHDAIHRLLELELHRDRLPQLIDGDDFDLRGLLKAEISIEDISAPEKVMGGEEILIAGRVMESLSDGTKIPAVGASVSLTSRPTLQEHLSTSTDAKGQFSFVINHGVPPTGFDGIHQFAGWFDLDLNLSATSGRTSLVAQSWTIVPGEITVKLIGAYDNETGDDRLIGSVVAANSGKDVTLRFQALIAGQPLNRGVQMQAADVSVHGEGVVTSVTNPDGSGEFVVVFRPSSAADTVAYVSPIIRYEGFGPQSPARQAPGFAGINVV